jgi:hypothetical protein
MSGDLGLVAEWSRVNRLSKPSLQEMLVWFSTDPRSGLWASQLVVMGTIQRNTPDSPRVRLSGPRNPLLHN